MNGVTGRMGLNQHLRRSIYAIMKQGGVRLAPARRHHAAADPGGPQRRQAGGHQRGMRRHPLDHRSRRGARSPDQPIYFDAQTTDRRAADVKKAIAAGKHIYCEKPVSDSLDRARTLLTLAEKGRRQARRGAGQALAARPAEAEDADRLGFFGRIFSVRGEFGYWVFEGDTVPGQRPSWNYRKERRRHHHRHALPLALRPRQPLRTGEGRLLPRRHAHPERWDEAGKPYACTADDSAYATFESPAKTAASWPTSTQLLGRPRAPRRPAHHPGGRHQGHRRRRPAPLLDAALRQHPAPVWNPDVESPLNFFDGWQKGPEQDTFDNAFKVQWELFLRHVVKDEPFRWDLLEGAKGVQTSSSSTWRATPPWKTCWPTRRAR
jgi:hypothetical protein